MSDSVHAYIFFGVILANEDFHPLETPWQRDGISYEKDWWMKIKGFKPTSETRGVNESASQAMDRYVAERSAWFKQNPMPFETISLGSDEFDVTALRVSNSGCIAGRFEPCDFDPTKLVVTPEAVAVLKQFMQDQGINQEPRWHLGCRAP